MRPSYAFESIRSRNGGILVLGLKEGASRNESHGGPIHFARAPASQARADCSRIADVTMLDIVRGAVIRDALARRAQRAPSAWTGRGPSGEGAGVALALQVPLELWTLR